MQIHNPILTGSLFLNGSDLSSLTGSVATSASFNTRVSTIESKYATTGSNTFVGNQTVTGSLGVTGSITATGNITAQTLVVQTITSSVLYSSGSNIFGNSLTNTQQFTGSLQVTSSNASYFLGGNVGIGTNSPSYNLDVTGTGRFTGALTSAGLTSTGAISFTPSSFTVGSSTATDANSLTIQSANSNYLLRFKNAAGTSIGGFYYDGTNFIADGPSWKFINAATFSSSVTATDFIQLNAVSGYASKLIFYRAGYNYWNVGTPSNSTAFAISESSDLSSPALFLKTGGNVGIGTTSPSSNLVVNSNGETKVIIQTSNPSANSNVVLEMNGNYYYDGIIRNNSAGSLVFQTNGTSERMRITSGGDLLFRKTSSTVGDIGVQILRTNGDVYSTIPSGINTYHVFDATNAQYRFYVSAAGTINATNTAISAISDKRLKENIVDLEIGLDAILALRPRKFDWKKESGNNGKNIRGFIAQEFEEVFPDLIDQSINAAPEGEEPYKQIRQDLIPVLVKAIQEQQQTIQDLTNRLINLENK
jgi:hypothetical protein